MRNKKSKAFKTKAQQTLLCSFLQFLRISSNSNLNMVKLISIVAACFLHFAQHILTQKLKFDSSSGLFLVSVVMLLYQRELLSEELIEISQIPAVLLETFYSLFWIEACLVLIWPTVCSVVSSFLTTILHKEENHYETIQQERFILDVLAIGIFIHACYLTIELKLSSRTSNRQPNRE